MELAICKKHNKQKNFLFCIEQSCKERLTCNKCYIKDKIHNDHQFILLEDLNNGNIEDLEESFDSFLIEAMKNGKNTEEMVKSIVESSDQ